MFVPNYLFILLSVVLMAPAVADVYKYVDENGNVVYSDEPPPNSDSEVVELEPYAPPSTPTPIGRVTRDSEFSQDIEHVDPDRIDKLAREAERDQDRWCNEARVALEVLHQGMPVYRVGDGKYRAAWGGDTYDGPRVYLSERQREAAINGQVRKLVMNCKDPLNEEEQLEASEKWRNSERCEAARVNLAEVLEPGSRAPDQAIEDRQEVVDQYCKD